MAPRFGSLGPDMEKSFANDGPSWRVGWCMKAVSLLVALALVAAAAAAAAPTPLTFVWPTSVDVEPDGSLLVVENGLRRLDRVSPAGEVTQVATLTKPYAVQRTRSGSIYVTDGPALRRIDGAGAPAIVTRAVSDIGPIAVARNGDVYFTTEAALWKLPRGKRAPVRLVRTTRFSSPHGLALMRDRTVLVADTGDHRIVRVAPARGKVTVFARLATPAGIEAAGDGTVYVVDAAAKRILHLAAGGRRLGYLRPTFGDPYALALAPGGVIYVVDTAETGYIRRIAPDGTVTTVSS
jgi:streptogramin lyase